ncbi:MAG TPA: TonB-dependent receptor, partial [Adhaeribacter sp.]|nr:TonB-dependent receptor [Adhaeribacter sp.]
TRFSADLSPKLKAEAAISLNYYHYKFQPLAGSSVSAAGRRSFNPEWMPRLGLSYAFSGSLAWRASLSRGYSPPTLAEIRPSDQQLNTRLEAETGYNVETGFRFSSTANRFQADVSVYNYRLRKAIVRRLDASGAEFFTNAGGTSQTGLEALLSGWLIPYQEGRLVKGLQLSSSFTFNYFRFSNYRQNETDLSGNRLTGTPQEVVVSGVILHLPAGFIFSGQHNFTGRLPLNDANTVYAGSYHLVQAKLRWLQAKSKDHALEFYAGADNLLNQKFSLGNDLNAFGNRYYNAAPLRSWYVGASINFR